MRIQTTLLGIFLLFPASGSLAQSIRVGEHDPAIPITPIDRAALSGVNLRNVGPDELILTLTRRAAGEEDYYRSARLRPGERILFDVPNLPLLRLVILRYGDVMDSVGAEERERLERIEPGDNRRSGRRGAALALGLGLALAGDRDRARDDQDEHAEERPHPGDDPPRDHHPPSEAHPRDDGEVPTHGNEREDDRRSGQGSELGRVGGAIVLGTLLSQGRRDSQPGQERPQQTQDDTFAGAVVLLEAADGAGTRVVHGLEAGTTVVDASTKEGRNRANQLATTEHSEPDGSSSSSTTAPCYCGPDVTAAYVESIKRARDRVLQLPDSETGLWDAVWFMSRNGGSIDLMARPARRPGISRDAEISESDVLCPSGPCADLPPIGGPTFRLFGYCFPKHVGNDIMYGYVAAMLNLPCPVQTAGGYYADFASYRSIDPPASRSAYKIGNYIAELDLDDYSIESIREKFLDAWRFRDRGSSVDAIQRAYPALAQCEICPADRVEAGSFVRDWTTSEWSLEDNGKYPYQPTIPSRGN